LFLDAEITGYALKSGAGFIIALGVIIIILSALGKSFFFIIEDKKCDQTLLFFLSY
jgi:hypothetical protein